MRNFFLTFIFFCILINFRTSSVKAYDYSIDVPYQKAVIEFFRASENALSDVENKKEIAEWGKDLASRISEFISDQIDACKEMSEQFLFAITLSPFYKFVNKWLATLSTCPQCDQVVAIMVPLFKDLFKDLPSFPPPQPNASPFSRFYDYFKEMEILNPWEVGPFFKVSPLKSNLNNKSVSESYIETVKGEKGKKSFILDRTTVGSNRGNLLFQEIIHHDQLQEFTYKQPPLTVLHEAWAKLVAKEGPTPESKFWEGILYIVDNKIAEATQTDLFDPFIYHYWFDPSRIKNEIAQTIHPLRRTPSDNQFKINEFYPKLYYDPHCYGPKNCQLTDYLDYDPDSL